MILIRSQSKLRTCVQGGGGDKGVQANVCALRTGGRVNDWQIFAYVLYE